MSTTLEATIAATQSHRPARDDGLGDNESAYVDATNLVNDLRRDLRRLKRAVRINTILLSIVLLLTVILPTTVVLLRP